MGVIQYFIVIRDYKPGDEMQSREIVREGSMSTVNNAFMSFIEVTFQLTVLTTAAMFIFLGLPFTVCLSSIPVVVIFVYFCIWSGHMFKAMELTQDLSNIPRVYMSSNSTGFWVAEAYEPFFKDKNETDTKYVIWTDREFKSKNIDPSNYRRTIVGTVGIIQSNTANDYAWLRRMAVRPKYQRIGVGKALLEEALHFCGERDYQYVELVTTEWHDGARNLYVKAGFQLKQMYHKKLIGSVVAVLVFQLYFKITTNKITIDP